MNLHSLYTFWRGLGIAVMVVTIFMAVLVLLGLLVRIAMFSIAWAVALLGALLIIAIAGSIIGYLHQKKLERM